MDIRRKRWIDYSLLKIKECWHALFLIPQKPDFSLKKATKVKDHEASKSQRSKKIWLMKIFLFDFWPNWTILSHLAKVFLVFHGRDCKGLFLTLGRGVWPMMTSAKKDIWLQSQQMHKQEYSYSTFEFEINFFKDL